MKDEGVPLGAATNFILGCMYRSVVCKLYEIIILLYITIVKYQLEYCVKDFTFQDGYRSLGRNFKENKNHLEKKTSEEKLKRLNAFVWRKLEGEAK